MSSYYIIFLPAVIVYRIREQCISKHNWDSINYGLNNKYIIDLFCEDEEWEKNHGLKIKNSKKYKDAKLLLNLISYAIKGDIHVWYTW